MKNELSRRLKTIAALCKPTECIADIGCDHGFMSIYLITNGIAERAIASDINKGPLSRAKEHVEAEGLTERIDLRLSDGLSAYVPGEATAMLAAGMGGPLMQSILVRGIDCVLKMQYLILQPQSEIPEFRAFLRTNGFVIEDEELVFEDGKFYPMMRVLPPHGDVFWHEPEALTPEDVFGPVLLSKKHPVLITFLNDRIICLSEISKKLDDKNAERRAEILREIDLMKEIRRQISE